MKKHRGGSGKLRKLRGISDVGTYDTQLSMPRPTRRVTNLDTGKEAVEAEGAGESNERSQQGDA
jgi:hypothetical protein